MTTELVLTYLLVDDTYAQDKTFNSVTALAIWLHGHRKSDFIWLTLQGDTTNDGWDAIFGFIQKSIVSAQRTVCDDSTNNHALAPHDLSQCGDACNCMKCNPSKSSCIALRASELSLPHVDVGAIDLPRVERFSDLPNGTLFYLAQTYAYGGRQKYQKTLEDGGDHNAVWVNDPNTTARIPDNFLVIRA